MNAHEGGGRRFPKMPSVYGRRRSSFPPSGRGALLSGTTTAISKVNTEKDADPDPGDGGSERVATVLEHRRAAVVWRILLTY